MIQPSALLNQKVVSFARTALATLLAISVTPIQDASALTLMPACHPEDNPQEAYFWEYDPETVKDDLLLYTVELEATDLVVFERCGSGQRILMELPIELEPSEGLLAVNILYSAVLDERSNQLEWVASLIAPLGFETRVETMDFVTCACRLWSEGAEMYPSVLSQLQIVDLPE
jgi:hypothetical protein